ncbi:MAG: WG repeat-containing protein [Paludibacteraceae bacterium]|nr:WG repeat-containing protein [Paludibacteraceae bacterium]
MIRFNEDGKEWGYLDKDGKVVIPEQFYSAGAFAGGIAVVAKVPFLPKTITGSSSDQSPFAIQRVDFWLKTKNVSKTKNM